MTKAEIINKIVEDTGLPKKDVEDTGLPKKDVAATVEAFMEEIRNCMAVEKENVYLRGFGTFIVKRRAQKTARNISKNTTMVIAAHDIPAFKPAKSFLEKMTRIMPNGKKKKGHKMATHKRKKRLRKNRHKSK